MVKLVPLAAALALLLFPGWAGMKWLENVEGRYLFFPAAAIAATPADERAEFEEVYFLTSDGVRLNGWFLPAPARAGDAPAATVAWFHGNGGNLGHRAADVSRLAQRLGVNVFIFDYRGYGLSEGRPTEDGLYLDARAALAYLNARDDVNPNRLVFLGRSLGAAVAVELAAALPRKEQPAGVILVSPFTSIKDMALVRNRYNPLRFLIPDRFNNLARIGQIQQPLLVIHSDVDEVVPVSQGQQLYAAAGHPKAFHLWRGAGHNAALGPEAEELWGALEYFLASLEAPR